MSASSNPNQSSSETMISTGVGFWLPCGRTNFYDPIEDSVEEHGDTLITYAVAEEPTEPKLDSSVLRRLADVLPVRGYKHLTHLTSSRHSSETLYPNATVFFHLGTPKALIELTSSIDKNAKAKIDNWTAGVDIDGLILMATSQGFYYLIAIHRSSLPQESVIESLRVHIASIFGDFYSHLSGRIEDEVATDDSQIGVFVNEYSLTDYQNFGLGILNFFQINALIEGIYNSNFNPAIFFRERKKDQEFKQAKEGYNLALFSKMISTRFELSQSKDVAIARLAQLLRGEVGYQEVSTLRNIIEAVQVKEAVLNGFLNHTAHMCLKPLKLMIERCRRALLTKMLEFTHRRDPIIQAESPTIHSDHILVENEGQLRGYIMLVSAKLPVISNIESHLEEQGKGVDDRDDPDESNSSSKRLEGALNSWKRLVGSIKENVREIEAAIQQSRMDSLLWEQSQLRAEQETAAELQSARHRFGQSYGGGGGGNNSASYLAQYELMAWCTIVCGFLTIPSTLLAIMNAKDEQRWLVIITGLIVPGFILFGVGWNIYRKIRSEERSEHLTVKVDESHYEMDFHLDEEIEEADVEDLKRGEFARARSRHGLTIAIHGTLAKDGIATKEVMGTPKLRGYRSDRLSKDEEVIKVHLEVEVPWPINEAKKRKAGWFRKRESQGLIVSLNYEILLHHPSRKPHWVFRDIRAIAILKAKAATPDQIEALRTTIVDQYINVFLKKVDRIDLTKPVNGGTPQQKTAV